MRVALEVQHRVDDVLQHARAGERAFLGDVADQHDGRAARLGGARQLRRAFAHLRHRAGRGGELVGVERLDRVDHAEGRALGLERGEDLLELDLGQHAHLRAVEAEPARAQRHLGTAFFAGDVEHVHPRADSASTRLQQQGGLADARVAADQHHAAGDDAAAEHAVEFLDGRWACARHRPPRSRDSVATGCDCASDWKRFFAGASATVSSSVFQALQLRALAEPLGAGAAAFGAGVEGLFLGHGGDCGRGLRRSIRGTRLQAGVTEACLSTDQFTPTSHGKHFSRDASPSRQANPGSTTTSCPISDIQRLAQDTPADDVMVVTLGSDHPSKLLDELDQLNRPCKVMLHLDQKGVAAEALLGALKNIPCIQHLHVTGPRSFFRRSRVRRRACGQWARLAGVRP